MSTGPTERSPNAGQNTGWDRGIHRSGHNELLVNHGLIETLTTDADRNDDGFYTGGDNDVVRNYGTIAGDIELGSDPDHVRSTGIIDGILDLESGDHVHGGRGGSVGLVESGNGSDSMLGGADDHTFEGGSGSVLIDLGEIGGEGTVLVVGLDISDIDRFDFLL